MDKQHVSSIIAETTRTDVTEVTITRIGRVSAKEGRETSTNVRPIKVIFKTSNETWPNDSISSDEFNLPHYSIFKCDKNPTTSRNQQGGGVIIAVLKKFSCTQVSPTVNNIEQLFVLVKLGSTSIIVNAVYIPLDSPHGTYLDVHYVLNRFSNYLQLQNLRSVGISIFPTQNGQLKILN